MPNSDIKDVYLGIHILKNLPKVCTSDMEVIVSKEKWLTEYISLTPKEVNN